jgi:ribosome-binding protein aMBF1 (putative translation factor)
MKINPKRLQPWSEITKDWFNDPEFVKEYEKQAIPFKIAEDLIKLRLASGLTQKEFAKKINNHQSEVARLESGTRNLTVAKLQQIAEATGAKLTISLKLPGRSKV